MDPQSPFTSAGPDNATYPIERSSLQFCDSPLWDTALLWNTETPRYFEMRDLGPSCFSQFHTVLRDHSAGLPPHLGPPPPPPRRLDHPLQKCCQRCKFFAKTKKSFQICHASICPLFHKGSLGLAFEMPPSLDNPAPATQPCRAGRFPPLPPGGNPSNTKIL